MRKWYRWRTLQLLVVLWLRRWWRPLFVVAAVLLVLDSSGVHRHLLERDYAGEFTYPLTGDVRDWTRRLSDGAAIEDLPVEPLHQYGHRLLLHAERACVVTEPAPHVLLVVKSALDHWQQRAAIRRTWGQRRSFPSDDAGERSEPRRRRRVEAVFLVGRRQTDPEQEAHVRLESSAHGDIVMADFYDSYFNNTLKTMSGFRWALTHCSGAEFVFFVDDDFYVSVPNMLRLARSPLTYPAESMPRVAGSNPGQPLLVGYVFHSAPHRHKLSKWYVPLSEYPFSLWPPYCTAGAYLVSHRALSLLHYASYFTQHFRFDDIYVGLLARKADVRPLHTDHVLFWDTGYDAAIYRHVVAAHGYSNADLLTRVWNIEHALGRA